MSDIKFPYDRTNGIVDKEVSDAGHLSTNLFNPLSKNSLAVINGNLDAENREESALEAAQMNLVLPDALKWRAKTVHLQRFAASAGRSVGSTLNLNYFATPQKPCGDWNWGDAVAGGGAGSVNDDEELYRPIPGAAIEWHLPHTKAGVLLSWNIGVTCYEDVASESSWADAALRLFVNGDKTDLYHLIPPMDCDYDASASQNAPHIWNRWWSGHYLYSGTEGWQTASIRLGISSGIEHVRVRTRAFTYVYFH